MFDIFRRRPKENPEDYLDKVHINSSIKITDKNGNELKVHTQPPHLRAGLFMSPKKTKQLQADIVRLFRENQE